MRFTSKFDLSSVDQSPFLVFCSAEPFFTFTSNPKPLIHLKIESCCESTETLSELSLRRTSVLLLVHLFSLKNHLKETIEDRDPLN